MRVWVVCGRPDQGKWRIEKVFDSKEKADQYVDDEERVWATYGYSYNITDWHVF